MSTIAFLILSGVLTQTEQPVQQVFERRTVVTFSEVTLTGETARPDGSYVRGRRSAVFQSMVRFRANFNPEILKSVESLY